MITLHNDIKKPSRSTAFNIVKTALEDCQNKHSVPIDRMQLEELYKYFTPSMPAKAKTIEQYIARFVGVNFDYARRYLNFIYVKNGKMIGTNDHTLAVTDTDMSDGYYNPKTLDPIADMETVEFPSFEQILKGKDKCRFSTVRVNHDFETIDTGTKGGKPILTYVLSNKKGEKKPDYGFNKKYVDTATNRDEGIIYGIHEKILHIRKRVDSHNVEILIMPLNV